MAESRAGSSSGASAAGVTELLHAMEDYAPILPDEVTDHLLARSGFQTSDPRVTRLVSLAAHKFIADLSNDALQRHKQTRQVRPAGKSGKSEARLVLTTEDLAASAKDHGITLRKPAYYADAPADSTSAFYHKATPQ